MGWTHYLWNRNRTWLITNSNTAWKLRAQYIQNNSQTLTEYSPVLRKKIIKENTRTALTVPPQFANQCRECELCRFASGRGPPELRTEPALQSRPGTWPRSEPWAAALFQELLLRKSKPIFHSSPTIYATIPFPQLHETPKWKTLYAFLELTGKVKNTFPHKYNFCLPFKL